MIRVCTGFPNDWPAALRDQVVESFRALWPASIELMAGELQGGGDLDRIRLSAPAAASADMADGDILAWLDPDIETVSSVPSFVIPNLLKDADLCYIGTDAGEADLAFWAVRISPIARRFLAASATSTWADGRAQVELMARDLTPGGLGDLWGVGPLGRYTRRLARPA